MTRTRTLELRWVGKEARRRVEPRVLVEDAGKGHRAAKRVGARGIFDNVLVHGDNLPALRALEADWWHAPALDYPVTDWEANGAPPSDRLVDSLRRVDFETRPRHASTLYLTLSWQPPSPARG